MNDDLRDARLPDPDGPLMPILEFALAYNAYARLAEAPNLGRLVSPVMKALAKTGEPPSWAGVDFLRGALFFLQRQTHHWGEVPPEQERQMRTLVRSVGQRVGQFAMVTDPSV